MRSRPPMSAGTGAPCVDAGCATSVGGARADGRSHRVATSCDEIAEDPCVANVPAARAEDDFSLALHIVADAGTRGTLASWEFDDAMRTIEPGVA